MTTALPLHGITDGVVRGACHHDCPDTCLWEVTVADGIAVKLTGAADHPTTAGGLCPKVNRFLDRVHHPDRLVTPMLRRGPKGSGTYVPISWDAAIELMAGCLTDVAGPSVLQYSFDGTQGLVQKGIVADRFFTRLGASDIRRDLCGTTSWMGAEDVLGQPFGLDPEELVHARTILLWGTNTRHTNRHLWPTIEAAREAGAWVVVIDPIRTETAASVDEHVQLRPGTDVALVLAMIHVMDRDGLLDEAWLADRTTGWPELQADARAMTPAAASDVTGVPAEQIEALATRFATVGPAAVRTLIGMEHRERGREAVRAVAMLPCVTGAWRERGGGYSRSTQIWFETALGLTAIPGSEDRPRYNMSRLGDVLTADDRIQVLVVHNSNPAVTVPDTNRVVAGLEREDLFTVVLDQFMTDTAQYADLVLPVTTQIEHLDLALAWGHLYLALNRPAVAPRGQALPNSEIFRRLATACGFDDPALHESDEDVIRALLDTNHPWLKGITFESLWHEGFARLRVREGHRPHVDGDLGTVFALGSLDASLGRETLGAGDDEAHPLQLQSRKQAVKFLNSHYGGFPKHLPKGGEPRLAMHPDDMASRLLWDGDIAAIWNDRGRILVHVEADADLQPGLVTYPFGFWHREGRGGRGVNVLTNPAVADDDRGTSFFHDTRVQIARADQVVTTELAHASYEEVMAMTRSDDGPIITFMPPEGARSRRGGSGA